MYDKLKIDENSSCLFSPEEFQKHAMSDIEAFCKNMRHLVDNPSSCSGLFEYRTEDRWYATFVDWLRG